MFYDETTDPVYHCEVQWSHRHAHTVLQTEGGGKTLD